MEDTMKMTLELLTLVNENDIEVEGLCIYQAEIENMFSLLRDTLIEKGIIEM